MRTFSTVVPTLFNLLGFLLILPSAPSFAQSITYDVRAFIDGSSVLIIQGNSVTWHNLAFFAPGKYVAPDGTAHNDATVISSTLDNATVMNGHNWFPNWPTGVVGDQTSDPLLNLTPALPSTDVAVTLNIIRARESITAYVLPSPSNSYTLAILFSDFNTLGADWYEARISIAAPSSGTGLPDWTLVSTSPTSLERMSMNMAFDSGRQRVVMFGGRQGQNTSLSDTYEYARPAWNKVLTPHSPPARFWAGMAYDDARKRTVLFGGNQNDVTRFNDTWEYDGNDWRSISTVHSPAPQDGLSMAYDSCRQRTVVLTATPLPTETWEYDGSDWTKVMSSAQPPARRLAAMVFDRQRCRAILFGGLPEGPLNALSDTWEYDGANWTQIATAVSPSGRWGHAMAYDTNRGRVVLFGGYGPVYPAGLETNDTWEYDGSTWVQVFPQHSPAPQIQNGMAYDATNRSVVLFGGLSSQTWEYTSSVTSSCTFSVAGPSTAKNIPFGPANFDYVVTTQANCNWTTSSNNHWISVSPASGTASGVVHVSLSQNIDPNQRTGQASIAGTTLTFMQDGTSTCAYSISPASRNVGRTGALITVNVTATAGCPWTASSSLPWAVIESGQSGTGAGAVSVRVQSNSGASRSGILTIAGKNFTISQDGAIADFCGATDINSLVNPYRSGMRPVPPLWNYYSESITIKNNTNQPIPGPIQVVFDGLPRVGGIHCPSGCGLYPNPGGTYCKSPTGSSIVVISAGPLAPGQSVQKQFLFTPGPGYYPDLSYTAIVISGTPSK